MTFTKIQNQVVVMPEDEFFEKLRKFIDSEFETRFGPLMSIIAVKQKDACQAMGVTDDTARNRVANGKLNALQRDGSRLVYYELREVGGLKPRSRRKKI
ncbi:MAG: hypothetical protein IPM50_15190 [Acidobacteriota bacterium]|nr:MAG: hypothetical protein IPM50_15190 [Acidobacteriota bacterium]